MTLNNFRIKCGSCGNQEQSDFDGRCVEDFNEILCDKCGNTEKRGRNHDNR